MDGDLPLQFQALFEVELTHVDDHADVPEAQGFHQVADQAGNYGGWRRGVLISENNQPRNLG